MRSKASIVSALVICLSALCASVPAAAAVVVYGGPLLAANEAPTPSSSAATGNAIVLFDAVAQEMRVIFTFNNLEGTPTLAHIHCCIPNGGVAAGVATELPSFDGFPLPGAPRTGIYDRIISLADPSNYNPAFLNANGGTTTGALARLAGGLADGRAYLNVHTSLFPAGEIRANLRQVVPEPALGALWLVGVGAAFAMRRRVAN